MEIKEEQFSHGGSGAESNCWRIMGLLARLLGLIILLAMSAKVQAEDYTYIITNETVEITGYIGSAAVATIPSVIDSLPVKSLGGLAFYGANLQRIMIPNSVTNIDGQAFASCNGLAAIVVAPSNAYYKGLNGVLFDKSQTKLILYPPCKVGSDYSVPFGATLIGEYAFAGNSYLTSVTIPSSVTNIGSWAFSSCTQLIGVWFNGNPPSADWSVFNGDENATLYYLPGTSGWDPGLDFAGFPMVLQNFIYTSDGDTITITGYSGVGDVKIPSEINGLPVAGIGNDAFSLFLDQGSITIPASIKVIGARAVSVCSSIVVNAQNPLFSSLNGVLFNKKLTSLIQFPQGRTGSYTIPGGVSSIAPGAFFLSVLTDVKMPSSIKNIDAQAFYGCAKLGSLAIPNAVTNIGDAAFYGCASVTGVTLPSKVTRVGDEAFGACASLLDISVSSQNKFYTSVDGVLFTKSKATLLQYPAGRDGSYAIPNGVTLIGRGAFRRCDRLGEVAIPNSVVRIGPGAFAGCDGVTLHDGFQYGVVRELCSQPLCLYSRRLPGTVL